MSFRTVRGAPAGRLQAGQNGHEAEARPASITVLRMEVPCCAGIAGAALEARGAVAPDVPAEVHTVGIRGDITREVVGVPAAGEGGPC